MALDLKPGAEAGTWMLTQPATPDSGLSGELLALAARPEGGVVVGGWLSGPAGFKLWSLALDQALCVERAWVVELGPAGARPEALLALPDGGLVAGGTAPGPGLGNDEAWVARYDGAGEELWSTVQGEFLYVSGLFETPSRERVTALAALPDGGFAAAGGADVNDALYSNWLLLLDGDGKVRQRLDLPRDDPRTPGRLAAVVPRADGGLWLAGTLAPGTDKSDAWALALAPDLTLAWDRHYTLSERQEVTAAIELGDTLLFAGQQRGTGAGGDGWFGTLDGEGEIAWTQVWRTGALRANETLQAMALSGSAVLLAGSSGLGPWILAQDFQGRPLDSRALDGGGSLVAVTALADGRALAGGRRGSQGPPLLVLLERLE